MYKVIAIVMLSSLPTFSMANSLEVADKFTELKTVSENGRNYQQLSLNHTRKIKRRHRIESEQRRRQADAQAAKHHYSDPISDTAHFLFDE